MVDGRRRMTKDDQGRGRTAMLKVVGRGQGRHTSRDVAVKLLPPSPESPTGQRLETEAHHAHHGEWRARTVALINQAGRHCSRRSHPTRDVRCEDHTRLVTAALVHDRLWGAQGLLDAGIAHVPPTTKRFGHAPSRSRNAAPCYLRPVVPPASIAGRYASATPNPTWLSPSLMPP